MANCKTLTRSARWKGKSDKAIRVNRPVLYSVERVFVGNIVHEDEAHSTAVVGCRYCPIPFLSGRVLRTSEYNKQPNKWVFGPSQFAMLRTAVQPVLMHGRTIITARSCVERCLVSYRNSVCLCVCLSNTRPYCVKTNECRMMVSSPAFWQ